jgi:hypothetical protein
VRLGLDRVVRLRGEAESLRGLEKEREWEREIGLGLVRTGRGEPLGAMVSGRDFPKGLRPRQQSASDRLANVDSVALLLTP